MFEVKIQVNVDRVAHTITIATFERSVKAIVFAKQIDPAYAVEIIEVENENNAEKAFGLIYHRDAQF